MKFSLSSIKILLYLILIILTYCQSAEAQELDKHDIALIEVVSLDGWKTYSNQWITKEGHVLIKSLIENSSGTFVKL